MNCSTCNPTRIRFVSAPSGKTAWTCGTTVLLKIPPSGPIKLLSCLTRETTAKYCGKSRVIIRQMRFLSSSSGGSKSDDTGQRRAIIETYNRKRKPTTSLNNEQLMAI